MKMHIRSLFLMLLFLNCNTIFAEAASTNSDISTQEIRFSSANANEVFFVWGINYWQNQDKALWPQGTFLKDNLLYTPMKKEEGFFSVKLDVKTKTQIDYVFWITKGPRNSKCDVWDINLPNKDYHLFTYHNSITLVESKVNIVPKESLSILDFSGRILIFSIFIFAVCFLLKKYRFNELAFKMDALTVVISFGGILALTLFFIRASVLWISWDMYFHPIDNLPKLLGAGFYDLLYVLVLTSLFAGLILALRKFPKIKTILMYSFILVGILSIVAGILNIKIVEMLGKPFNYRWFYYSDFLNSSDSKAALSSNISGDYILNIICICAAVIISGVLIVGILEIILQKYKLKYVLLTILVLLNVTYITYAKKSVASNKWEYDKLANPVTAFLESVNPFDSSPSLFTMELPDSLKIFEGAGEKPVSKRDFNFPTKIKNVILFVMESTPAEYIQTYKSKYSVTPELDKYISNAVVFENVYAHAPATNKTMVTLLGSLYPWLSYNSVTQEHPDVKTPTLSSELKKQGYRTSFFNSADNHFQRAGEFLGNRSFDEIKDCKTLKCAQQFQVKDEKWDGLDGMDDECTGDELMSWINKDREKPFFTMMWTYQTHYPYYATGEEKLYCDRDPILNRYLNAVHHSDQVLGKLLDELKKNGLSESTLVVVVGDHGEAFGTHNQTTHASHIYEENLHVPCIFINPQIKAERNAGIGGLSDVAPTIMNMLGFQSPKKWEGKDLFASDKNGRVYFFSPWSDYLFGYREGHMKYIVNASKGITEIYDLEKDPEELNNLASTTEDILPYHQRLASWIQYQNKYMDELFNAKAN
jgi:lipoteichoic acid synthase